MRRLLVVVLVVLALPLEAQTVRLSPDYLGGYRGADESGGLWRLGKSPLRPDVWRLEYDPGWDRYARPERGGYCEAEGHSPYYYPRFSADVGEWSPYYYPRFGSARQYGPDWSWKLRQWQAPVYRGSRPRQGYRRFR